ncbi:unnamed protein product [Durusdinium trenchii]|uniref:Uncharacterized protein n=1 Tax=Durusdinium trenchii TaxID=1381693 RepID=A0ABP0KAV5_9DINO
MENTWLVVAYRQRGFMAAGEGQTAEVHLAPLGCNEEHRSGSVEQGQAHDETLPRFCDGATPTTRTNVIERLRSLGRLWGLWRPGKAHRPNKISSLDERNLRTGGIAESQATPSHESGQSAESTGCTKPFPTVPSNRRFAPTCEVMRCGRWCVQGRTKADQKSGIKRNLKSRHQRKSANMKTVKGWKTKAVSTDFLPKKAHVSRQAALKHVREVFERFQAQGASPNAAAASALREIAGLAPLASLPSRQDSQMDPQGKMTLLPPTSWGGFEPSEHGADIMSDKAGAADANLPTVAEKTDVMFGAEVDGGFKDSLETVLDTQSTELEPSEAQDSDSNGTRDKAEMCEDIKVSLDTVLDTQSTVEADVAEDLPMPEVKPRCQRQSQGRKAKKLEEHKKEASSHRTCRQRIPPLEHWKNERCVYERKSGSSVPTLAAVVKCPSTEEQVSTGKGKQGKVKQAAGKKRTWHEAIASESLASPSLPSIYDIANKRTRQEAKTSTKQEKEKHEKRDKKEKEKVPHKSKTEVQQSQVTGRGLMGALEAARAEATKMRTIARSFASVGAHCRAKPSLARMAAEAAAAVGNCPTPQEKWSRNRIPRQKSQR